MLDVTFSKKNKVNLKDYDYQRDIKNRLLMSNFSPEDIEVLEEIIYSPTKFQVSSLVEQLDKPKEKICASLDRLKQTQLFKLDGDTVTVDKELRKYFENQIVKFQEGFNPGMEFLQTLLKKVPIHVLPTWYPIPRTSNNIMDSLIEKYLITPQTFQRYLTELTFGDEMLTKIIEDLFHSDSYKVYSAEIKSKYGLDDETFEEYMLNLEFHFIGCLSYERQESEWVEVVTLFREWKDYLSFMKESRPKGIKEDSEVQRVRPSDFSFIQDMASLLSLSADSPIALTLNRKEEWIPEKGSVKKIAKQCQSFDLESEEGQSFFYDYMGKVINKLISMKLAAIENRHLVVRNEANEWLSLPLDKRALNTYRFTLHSYPFSEFSEEICTERNIREIEKSVQRIAGTSWVLCDEFMRGIIAPISERSKMVLQKQGRYWKYSTPNYSEEEQDLIRLVTCDWLFEAGIIALGSYQGRECLRLTPLGESMFG